MKKLNELREFLKELRAPETGCAWTRAQDFKSLAPQTLEEAYELLDSIEHKDYEAVKDELGDLLYHITFYARIAEENELFDFDDLAAAALTKHHRRMPNAEQRQTMTSKEICDYWDEAKTKENPPSESVLDKTLATLPPLNYARKLQQAAANVGFDWPEYSLVFEKVQEELAELKTEIEHQSEHIFDEFGDLLFTCVNLARHLNIDPEAALRHSSKKFNRRFRQVEKLAQNKTQDSAKLSMDELEKLWQTVKSSEPKE